MQALVCTAADFGTKYPNAGTVLKRGTNWDVAASANTLTDGTAYETGWIKLAFPTSKITVAAKNSTDCIHSDYQVTVNQVYVVPVNTALKLTIAAGAASYKISDGAGIDQTEDVSTAANDVNITTGTTNITMSAVTKLTPPASVAGTLPATLEGKLSLAWTLNNESASGDVYVSATDVLKATVTFDAAFDDDADADEIAVTATGATVSTAILSTVGTAASTSNTETVTLTLDEIPASTTIVFTFTSATGNPSITYTQGS